MLSILVAHSYFLRFDQKQWERSKPYPPLATLHVAAMLRRAGHQVKVFDAMLANGVEDYRRLVEQVRPQLVVFYEDSFNFLSKMCLGRMREASCSMIAGARDSGARVLAVGSDATDAPEVYLQAGADVVVLGEGLVSLLALVARLDLTPQVPTPQWVASQYGVASLHLGRVATVTGARPLPNPLYADPPAWELINLELYRDAWTRAHGYFSLNMAASRGCSFRCNWCSKPIWGNQYLQRNPREVAAEMGYLKRTFSPDHIWFADDIFGFRVDWVADFANTLRSIGAGLPFTIQTRADLVSDAMAGALKDAGCAEVWLGAESGSQRILDAMNKGTTVQEILLARERLHAASIRVGFFIQLGYIGEGMDDILATRDLLERAQPDDVGVSVSYPLPGTKFYELVRQQLGPKTHWQESNDLEMMFQGTYTSDFYRAVRNLLHDQVTASQQKQPRACLTLQQRWQTLLSQERCYRSSFAVAATAG